MHISMCKLLVFSLPSSNNKDEFQSTVLEGKLGGVFFYMWKILQNHCYMKTREYAVKNIREKALPFKGRSQHIDFPSLHLYCCERTDQTRLDSTGCRNEGTTDRAMERCLSEHCIGTRAERRMKGVHMTFPWLLRMKGKMCLCAERGLRSPHPLSLNYLLLTDPGTAGKSTLSFTNTLMTQLAPVDSFNPLVTQMTLVKENGSPHKTKSHESRQRTGRDWLCVEVREVGRGKEPLQCLIHIYEIVK